MKGNVSIEHDERDFWRVNFFLIHEDPGDDGDVPDARRRRQASHASSRRTPSSSPAGSARS